MIMLVSMNPYIPRNKNLLYSIKYYIVFWIMTSISENGCT